jgi:glycosyl-4,4'-diaponeurosporenoate acyltransferase
MIFAMIAINSAAWFVIQLSIAWVITRMKSHYFSSDGRFLRVRGWEVGIYKRWLHISCWKRYLPDGAPLVGGRSKTLAARRASDLQQLIIETRRAEVAHWLMLVVFPVFALWNPPLWAQIVIGIYATLANMPCIIAQRYNRAKLQKMLLRSNALCA